MEKLLAYVGDIGKTISLVITDEDGDPVNLASSTVTLYMYAIGSDTAQWNHACTVDNAANGLAHYTTVSGDLATAGQYWTRINVAYVAGSVYQYAGPAIEVVSATTAENLVTVDEFLDFVDIPAENAKKENAIKTYLEHSEAQLYLDIPALRTTTDDHFIKARKMLIMKGAAIAYFMNSDEQEVDPNKRLQKIEAWQKDYRRAIESLGDSLSSDPEGGSAQIRRIKHSDYSDESSYLYETDE